VLIFHPNIKGMLHSVIPSEALSALESSFVHTLGLLMLLCVTQTLDIPLPDSMQSFQGYHGSGRNCVSTLLNPIR
jgi:hypothetical protein